MSIIIQAGHKASKSGVLMQKLYERGLGEPCNSYTHKLSVQQVVDTIDKILSRGDMSIANSKLADNIMVDFLLANMDNTDWGWESDKNLAALAYWQQLDPDVRFILVFDHPKYVLEQIQDASLDVQGLDAAINSWIAYHKSMLQIFKQYQEKAVLIEGISAIGNIAKLNEQVATISSALPLKSSWQLPKQTNCDSNNNSIPQDNLQQQDISKDLLIDEILRKYPDAIEAFNELLSKALLKASSQIYKTKRADLNDLVASFNKINEYHGHTQARLIESQDYRQELMVLQEEKKQWQTLTQQQLEQVEKKEQQLKNLQEQIRTLQSKVDSPELKQENQLLITQLHQVQEELESYYLKNQQYEKQLKEKQQSIDTTNKVVQDKQVQLDKLKKEADLLVKLKQELEQTQKTAKEAKEKQAQLEKLANEQKLLAEQSKKELNKLQAEMQNIQNKADSTELKQENELLVTQLHRVQEELERFYLENQRLKSDKIEKKTENEGQVYFGAAERIKNDLPYRLGAAMVKSSKTPKDIVSLPLSLVKEYRDFQQEQKDVELPPLEQYQDLDEAEKVKRHLSYRLGKTIVDSAKSPKQLVKLPADMTKEIIDFYKK